MKLILASTSPYRKELLSRFGLPFKAVSPDYEESSPVGLDPRGTALHHALGKARSLLRRYPDHLIIGSDQVAELDGDPLGKPGTEESARAQLARMSGRTVEFHTGVALVCRDGEECDVSTYRVTLRTLGEESIAAYVEREKPVDCAGSFKIEGLGIALMERLEGKDFTSLIGLPLIALRGLLERRGVDVLGRGRGFSGQSA